MDILTQVYWHNSVQQWLIALGIAVAVFVVLKIVQRVLVRRLRSLSKRTATDIDDMLVDMLRGTKRLVLLVAAVDIGAQYLVLSPGVTRVLAHVTFIAVLLQVALWGNHLVQFFIARSMRRRAEEGDSSGSLAALGFLSRIVLWTLVVLIALQNMGIDVTALVAGLGIGGIAIALAAQNILGDLFASLSIIVDRPFVVGDTINVDTFTGTVEHVGLKTTRVRSVSGEQLVFSNTDLLKSRIRNFKRMEERRVLFLLGVEYGTQADALRRIPDLVRGVIESVEGVRFDRAHFKEFGASSLNFEVVYYITSPDYTTYMDLNQTVHFGIHEVFTREGIAFAFPTQTLHLAGAGAAPVAVAVRSEDAR